MAIAVSFEAPTLTQEQYDKIMEQLQRGKTADGRIFHVAGPREGGGWQVLDVWQSQEALNRFVQEKLGPVMQELGVTPLQVTVWPVHNMLTGPENHL